MPPRIKSPPPPLLDQVNVVNCFLLVLVNVGEDCPVFDGMYEFCQLSAGGSIGMCVNQCNMKSPHSICPMFVVISGKSMKLPLIR